MKFFKSVFLFPIVFFGILSLTFSASNTASAFFTQFGYSAGDFMGVKSPVSGDLNGDGYFDIVTVNSGDNKVDVFINKGDGNFLPKVRYTGAGVTSVVVGDFNGDEKLDLAATNLADTVSVFLGNGNGTFAAKVDYAVGIDPSSIVAGDFNGDGKLDIATANITKPTANFYVPDTVSVLMNNGNGTFATKVDYAVGSNPKSIDAKDLNGDSKVDIVVANSLNSSGAFGDTGGNTISVLMNNGNGTFATKVNYTTGTSPISVKLGDINGDGKNDIVVANRNSNNISVFNNNGNGTFATKVDYATGTYLNDVAIWDINADSKNDIIVVGDSPAAISVFTNNGNGTFAPRVDFDMVGVGGTPTAVNVGDFNKDQKIDFITTADNNLSLNVYINNGDDNTIGSETNFAIPFMGGDVSTGDLNGDGKKDVVANSLNDIYFSIFYNNGNSTFAPRVDINVGMGGEKNSDIGDLNGDGKNDIVIVNYYDGTASNSTVFVYMNNGDGTFAKTSFRTGGTSAFRPVIADINGDGKNDITVANHGSNTLAVLMNNGNGTFASGVLYSVPGSPWAVAAGDLNGDGKNDIVVTNYDTYAISVFMNSGNGSLLPKVDYLLPTNSIGFHYVAIGDLNGDGKNDLAVVNSISRLMGSYWGEGKVSIFINKGNGTFGARTDMDAAGADSRFIKMTDFNYDGKIDLLVTNYGSPNLSLVQGKGNGTFELKVDYPIGSTRSGNLGLIDFDGDGKEEIALGGLFREGLLGYISVFKNGSISTDITPPDTSIVSAVDGAGGTVANGALVNSDELTFTFTGADNITPAESLAYTCSLDGGAYGSCPNPKIYSGLSIGAHTLGVKAVDTAGNTDETPATFFWTVNDTVLPETTITSADDGYGFSVLNGDSIISGDITFRFSGTDNVTPVGSLTFVCKIDTASFEPCGSPKTYNGLGLGAHSFQVASVDAAGNTDSAPDTFLWTIIPPPDTIAPETSVTLATDGNGSVVANGGTTGSLGMTLEFIGTDNVTLSLAFECSLDGAGFSSCTTPMVYSSLSAGSHIFQVMAKDEAGNTDPSPASFLWTIDLTPPETSIPPAIDSNGGVVTEGAQTTATGITITFSAEEGIGGSLTYKCKLDNELFASCESPKTYSGLSLGTHSFEVAAIDAVGNTDPTPAVLNWEIILPPDVTAPDTSITGALDGSGTSISNGGTTYSTEANFSFSGTDDRTSPDALTFTCKLDAGSFTPCASPVAYTGLVLGVHTLEVRATDLVGNTDEASPAVFSWTIALPPDETAPDTTIVSAVDGNNDPIADGGTTYSTSMKFEFAGTDDRTLPDSLTFVCALDAGIATSCVSPKTYSGLALGSHTLEISAKDAAGNTDATPATLSWTVVLPPDISAPDTNITSVVDGNGVTVGNGATTESKSITINFNGTDDRTSPSSLVFECAFDNAAFISCTSPKTYSNLLLGSHAVEVRAKDGSGNIDATPASVSWTIVNPEPLTTLGKLRTFVVNMGLGGNPEKHLLHNIDQAIKKLNDVNLKNDVKSVCKEMSDSIRDTNLALKNNEITSTQANALLDGIASVQQEFGCVVDPSNSVGWLLGLVADLNVSDKAKSRLSVKLDQAVKFLTGASDPALAKQQACKSLVEFTADVETQVKDKKNPITRTDADLLLASTQIVQREIGCIGTVARPTFIQSVFASVRKLIAAIGYSFQGN